MRRIKLIGLTVGFSIGTFIVIAFAVSVTGNGDQSAIPWLLASVVVSYIAARLTVGPAQPKTLKMSRIGGTIPPPPPYDSDSGVVPLADGECAYIELSEPGFVYLMGLPGTDMTKLGITKDYRKRVRDHQRHGWKLVELWEFDSIDEARHVEKTVHTQADSMGARPQDEITKVAMPQGGYTEVMSLPPAYVQSLVNGLALL